MIRSLASLGQNWGLALISLALAVALWLYVTEQQEPSRTGFLPGTVTIEAVNKPEGLAVTLPQQVRVRIAAPEAQWDDLRAENFRAQVDLKGLGPGQSEVPVAVLPPRGRVRLLEVIPEKALVTLEPEATRTVPVQVEIITQPPLGYEADSPRASPAQVTVRGPEEAVGRTEVAVAEVGLAGVTVGMRRTVKLIPRSAQGATVPEVSLSPIEAQVELPVLQKLFTRSLPISPALRGSPAPGYHVVGTFTTPPSVAVTAPLAVLEGLATIPTDEVDLSRAAGEVVREARLRLPAGATASQPSVLVRVQVAPAPGETTLSVAPRPQALARGLSIAAITPAILVRLGGPQPELLKLLPRDVALTVSLEGLGPGEHSLAPQVQTPAGLQVLELSPIRVEVTLQ